MVDGVILSGGRFGIKRLEIGPQGGAMVVNFQIAQAAGDVLTPEYVSYLSRRLRGRRINPPPALKLKSTSLRLNSSRFRMIHEGQGLEPQRLIKIGRMIPPLLVEDVFLPLTNLASYLRTMSDDRHVRSSREAIALTADRLDEFLLTYGGRLKEGPRNEVVKIRMG